MCEIYSSWKLEKACRYRVNFMWLLGGGESPGHSTIAQFRMGRCTEVAEKLFYLCQRKEASPARGDYRAAKQPGGGHGIYLGLCHSIQVERAFGLLKNDFGFRRFLTRGKENVRTELFSLAPAFELKKLYMNRKKGRLQTHLSEVMIA